MKIHRFARAITKPGLALAALFGASCTAAQAQAAHDFSLQQVLSAPFPGDLTPSPQGGRVAWIFNDRGVRKIWVEGSVGK